MLIVGILLCASSLLYCVKGPGSVEFGVVPKELVTYPNNSIRQMIELPDSTFLGLGYELYRINPFTPDFTGNIVFSTMLNVVFEPYNFSRMFVDSKGFINVIESSSIHRIQVDSQVKCVTTISRPVSTFPWCNHHYIDASSKAWVLAGETSNFVVYESVGGLLEKRMDGQLNVSKVNDLRFAADSSMVVFFSRLKAFPNASSTIIDIFDTSRCIFHETLFDSTKTIFMKEVFLLGNDIYAMILNYGEGWFSDRNKGMFSIRPNYWGIIKKDSMSTKWEMVGEFPNTDYLQYDQTIITYRNATEVWLHSSNGIVRVTKDDVVYESIRNSSINTFDLFCFRKDGSIVYFDEVTQKFITRNE